ncbi:chromate transporter [Hylemonella gracilis]|uniref:Putative chromate transporter n=1 Tax=Hylemonella gracilis ATCC 19624 TaxID=887062 RepID=F3KT41_9BURK|nr:chromate transporter [Hylemonella gracilis]EGI77037.1 putative chromate transporter [Hylemonella gracilis ATCC 19624]
MTAPHDSVSASPDTTALLAPRSCADLFVSFTVLALQGFGGVAAVAQRELVERKRWMTNPQFVEEWAVAQIMPGPNIVNLALMLGARHFGLRGALSALAGMLSAPLLVLLVLAWLHAQYASHPAVAGALRGMGAVAAGLVMGTGLKLLASLKGNPLHPAQRLLLGAACFVAIAWLRWPLVWVLLGLGGLGWALAWSGLARRELSAASAKRAR